jgi:hypothetical protein
LAYIKKIEEIWIYVSSSVEEWELDNLRILRQLKDKVVINLVLIDPDLDWSTEEKTTLIQCKQWAKLSYVTSNNVDVFRRICRIKVSNDKFYDYTAEDVHFNLDELWGSSSNGLIYRLQDYAQSVLYDLEISIDDQRIVEILINENDVREMPSNNLFSLIERKLQGQTELLETLRGETLEAIYSDKYLETPIGCLIMAQFINEFKTTYNFEISHFCFTTRNEISAYNSGQNGVFSDALQRNESVKSLLGEIGINDVVVSTDNYNLPHFRFLEFKNENVCVIIRPDAGFEHGWVKSRNNDVNIITQPISINHIYRLFRKSKSILYTISKKR